MILYKLAVEQAFGKKFSKASLHFLRDCSEWTLTQEALLEELKNLCVTISNKCGENDFEKNEDNCKYCQYKYLCN